MDTMQVTYDTVSDALERLRQSGYTHDFSLRSGGQCLVCNSTSVSLSPDDFQIDEIFRFEGASDPDDETILFAISSDKFGIKGFLVNAYSVYAEERNSAIVEKLRKKAETKKAPIKRHPALVEYSREHHFGLLLVWKIRQGIKNHVEERRISNYLLYFFQQELLPHFQAEEDELFSKLPETDTKRRKAETDHRRIYELIKLISNEGSRNLLLDFADTLDQHIRFEERILFGYLQPFFSEEELSNITRSQHNKKDDLDDSWNDHFWNIQKKCYGYS